MCSLRMRPEIGTSQSKALSEAEDCDVPQWDAGGKGRVLCEHVDVNHARVAQICREISLFKMFKGLKAAMNCQSSGSSMRSSSASRGCYESCNWKTLWKASPCWTMHGGAVARPWLPRGHCLRNGWKMKRWMLKYGGFLIS